MTVENICEKARISKPTFYRCFSSKFDVIPWWISWCNDRSSSLIGSRYSWNKGLFLAGCLYASMSDQIAFVENRTTNLQSSRQRIEVRRLEESLRKAVQTRTGQVSDIMSFCISAFSFLQNEILLTLCKRGSFSAEEFARMALSIVPRTLHDALALSSEANSEQNSFLEAAYLAPFAISNVALPQTLSEVL